MVFFQAALLGGYLYAHSSARLRPRAPGGRPRRLLLASRLPSCRRASAPRPRRRTPVAPALWLLLALTAAVGLPAAALASTAPLLQGWFAASGRPGSEDPYHLYGASNAGSLAALLGFPALLEPLLPLRQQAWLWSGGFVLLAGLILGAAWPPAAPAVGRPAPPAAPARASRGARRRPLAKAQLRWLLLAVRAVEPAAGDDTHLTTDVAAVPLLWVVPLALYLLTYVWPSRGAPGSRAAVLCAPGGRRRRLAWSCLRGAAGGKVGRALPRPPRGLLPHRAGLPPRTGAPAARPGAPDALLPRDRRRGRARRRSSTPCSRRRSSGRSWSIRSSSSPPASCARRAHPAHGRARQAGGGGGRGRPPGRAFRGARRGGPRPAAGGGAALAALGLGGAACLASSRAAPSVSASRSPRSRSPAA